MRTRPAQPAAGEKLDALFRRHSRELLRFFLRRTGGDAPRSEDLLQDVFLSATIDLERRPAGTPTLAWLYTVAHRRFVDDVRSANRQARTVPFDEAAGSAEPPAEYGPEVGRALAAVVRELPAIQHRVFVWKVFEGRSFSEIGAKIGISEGAARMQLLRALQAIRTGLENYGVGP
jgi:RNA polymerase sigma-70 factor (ECF subfamily)